MNDLSTLEATAEIPLDQQPLFELPEVVTPEPSWLRAADKDLADAIINGESQLEEYLSKAAPFQRMIEAMRAELLTRMQRDGARKLPLGDGTFTRKVDVKKTYRAPELLAALTEFREAGGVVAQPDIDAAVAWVIPDPVLKTNGTAINKLARDYGNEVATIIAENCTEDVRESLVFEPADPKKVRTLKDGAL